MRCSELLTSLNVHDTAARYRKWAPISFLRIKHPALPEVHRATYQNVWFGFPFDHCTRFSGDVRRPTSCAWLGTAAVPPCSDM